MKQLLILSGKGGTGKTTVASAFIELARAKAYADCDVDAPNLHLLMNQASEAILSDYYGLPKANINSETCLQCGLCKDYCRFDAIDVLDEYKIDFFACEGCGVCEMICPTGSITLRPAIAGELKLYKNDTVFSTAQLRMGSGTSGMLVSEVKKQMKSAIKEDIKLAIIDGSPGIGCPVIASISGVDMVLIVAEPSISGYSDMKRIINTARKFSVQTVVCVNKFETNIKETEKIEWFCWENNLPFVGKIPYDPKAMQAINNGQSIVDIDCIATQAMKIVFDNTINLLFSRNVRIYLKEI